MAISAYLLLLVSGLGFLPTSAKVIQSKLALSNNEFAFELYRKIGTANVGENVVFSPVGISLALALVHAGAGGKTKSQIATAMHLNDSSLDDQTINEGFKYIIETLNRPENNYTLQTANRLYGQSGHEFKAEYLNITKEYYGATLEALDFIGNSSGAREVINNWVAEMTSSKIKELFPKNSITPDTSLVLVNAVYLKASWLYKFNRM